MRIVGLDLGIRKNKAALCIMRTDGKIKSVLLEGIDNALPYWERYRQIIKKVLEHLEPKDVVFVEDYAHQANSASDARLKEIGGLVRYASWRKTGIYPLAVNIQTLKSWAGARQKNQILVQIYEKWGRKFDDDNKADSFLAADFGCHLLTTGYRRLTKHDVSLLESYWKRLSYDQKSALESKGIFANVCKNS